jgi:ATP-dependent Clp protease ATP-binding subunit ClpC
LRELYAYAQEAARSRDDDHVGTEHVTLALFRDHPNAARSALSEAGVTEEVYRSALPIEQGPSPAGSIPLTPRAVAISRLAIAEADRLSASQVGTEHVLLGVIRESEHWAALHTWGPHHLATAAESVGSSLRDIEVRLTKLLGAGSISPTQ